MDAEQAPQRAHWPVNVIADDLSALPDVACWQRWFAIANKHTGKSSAPAETRGHCVSWLLCSFLLHADERHIVVRLSIYGRDLPMGIRRKDDLAGRS